MSMGNPHAVVFVPDVAALDLPTLGPQFETHPSFPAKINTEFVQVGAYSSTAYGTLPAAVHAESYSSVLLSSYVKQKQSVNVFAGHRAPGWLCFFQGLHHAVHSPDSQ